MVSTNLLRLMAWLSPAFPVGSFSYSHGLEFAAHDRLVTDRAGLEDWLSGLVETGSLWNDAVLAAHAVRASGNHGELASLAELAEALAGSAERHMETMNQGRAFSEAARTWRGSAIAGLPENAAYPVAFGAVAGQAGIPAEQAVAGLLQAMVSNLVQAAIRLSIIGQTDGVRAVAAVEPLVAATADRAARASLDDLGAGTIRSEIVAMRHETQHSRLFRS
ncbi:MAG: urease accessory protein UreF [Rhizobiaceae bacterium]